MWLGDTYFLSEKILKLKIFCPWKLFLSGNGLWDCRAVAPAPISATLHTLQTSAGNLTGASLSLYPMAAYNFSSSAASSSFVNPVNAIEEQSLKQRQKIRLKKIASKRNLVGNFHIDQIFFRFHFDSSKILSVENTLYQTLYSTAKLLLIFTIVYSLLDNQVLSLVNRSSKKLIAMFCSAKGQTNLAFGPKTSDCYFWLRRESTNSNSYLNI